MTDKYVTGKSAAEQEAILAQNPLVLIGLDTLMALGYDDGYATELFTLTDFFGDDCACYTPNPDLLGRKVVGIVAKPVEFTDAAQWELYAGIVKIPRTFNAFKRYSKHIRDLLALVNPENEVAPGLLDRRVRALGGLAPREGTDVAKRMSLLGLTVISGKR